MNILNGEKKDINTHRLHFYFYLLPPVPVFMFEPLQNTFLHSLLITVGYRLERKMLARSGDTVRSESKNILSKDASALPRKRENILLSKAREKLVTIPKR